MLKTRKVLAQAVGSWLQYEFALGRGGLFSERYLSVPISQALAYKYKCGVEAEHAHKGLKEETGSHLRVDFAVIKDAPKVLAVVESKWANHHVPSLADIIWDIVRLEIVAEADDAEAFFVLAGDRSVLERIFDYKWGGENEIGSLLRKYRGSSIQIEHAAPLFRDALRQRFLDYPDASFPSRILLHPPYAYPEYPNEIESVTGEQETPTFASPKYQVWVWEIDRSEENRKRFTPSDHMGYSKTIF
ncbi:hypothetical protein ACU8OH_35660 (plasmid) [Rhizobium leguminosarum]